MRHDDKHEAFETLILVVAMVTGLLFLTMLVPQ